MGVASAAGEDGEEAGRRARASPTPHRGRKQAAAARSTTAPRPRARRGLTTRGAVERAGKTRSRAQRPLADVGDRPAAQEKKGYGTTGETAKASPALRGLGGVPSGIGMSLPAVPGATGKAPPWEGLAGEGIARKVVRAVLLFRTPTSCPR